MFVDDYSRFTWVFPMKTKVGVPVHFHTFRLKVENLCNARIQCVQCDGGGEYTSSSFIAYLPDHGITQHLSCPHTPSQTASPKGRLSTSDNASPCIQSVQILGWRHLHRLILSTDCYRLYSITRHPSISSLTSTWTILSCMCSSVSAIHYCRLTPPTNLAQNQAHVSSSVMQRTRKDIIAWIVQQGESIQANTSNC